MKSDVAWLLWQCQAPTTHRAQPDESSGRAGDRASRVGGPGRSNGLLHGARPATLCAGSKEACDGSSSLSDWPVTIVNGSETKKINKGRVSNSLDNI